jgi:hypothetical protein
MHHLWKELFNVVVVVRYDVKLCTCSLRTENGLGSIGIDLFELI